MSLRATYTYGKSSHLVVGLRVLQTVTMIELENGMFLAPDCRISLKTPSLKTRERFVELSELALEQKTARCRWLHVALS
jgi:hypothetical protein